MRIAFSNRKRNIKASPFVSCIFLKSMNALSTLSRRAFSVCVSISCMLYAILLMSSSGYGYKALNKSKVEPLLRCSFNKSMQLVRISFVFMTQIISNNGGAEND